MIKLPRFLMACAAGAVLSTAGAESPPNVLMIIVDDLNDVPKFMERYPDAHTPNLDRLAGEGMVFTQAHCQYPLCGPSRASFMSGFLPTTLGYTTHMKDAELEERSRDLGSELMHGYFAKHGYETLAVGKICHRHVVKGSVDHSGGRGNFHGGTGKLKANWREEGTSTDWAAAPERDSDLPDHDAATWARKRLDEPRERPFFMMVGFLRPHVPWYVPQKWFDLYPKRDELALPPFRRDDLDDVPDIARRLCILPQMPRTTWAIEKEQWSAIMQAYLACVSFTDHQVGRVLDALRESLHHEDTIVLLFSDHGYHLGEKDTFQKHSLWERASHVPLIVAGPGIESGRCERPVGLIDLYPTLLDLCRLPANPENEGRSLAPLLQDPDREWAHPVVTSWQGDNHAVQNERFRYIRYEDGSEELYDHREDLNEWTNLGASPDHQAIREELSRHLPSSPK